MTKERNALTFERAMTNVAAKIGWEEAARLVGRTERAVRNWSDPDTSAQVTLDHALQLDVAFLAAGGECAPFLEVYRTRLEADLAIATGCLSELNQSIALGAKEGGEAIAAAIVAAQPGASDHDLRRAEVEIEESISAKTGLLARIRALRHHKTKPASAPEVAPPAAAG